MKIVKRLQTEKQCSYDGCQEKATTILYNKYFCSEHYFLTKKIHQQKKKEKLKVMEIQ